MRVALHSRVRRLLAAATAAALAGCASGPSEAPASATVDSPVARWRVIQGGFLGAPAPVVGGPLRPGTGAFVRLVFPSAVAVRENELLIVDSGAGRVYRCDVALNMLTPIAGAPATPQTRVALGADLSAYVLDAPARRVLRFARDGRLIQTFRSAAAAADPVDFALAASGASILVIDRTLAQVAVFGAAGGGVIALRAKRDDGAPVGGASAIAVGRDDMYLLDVAAGVVHRVGSDGAILASFGRSLLAAPSALAVDRFERVYVAEPATGAIRVFAGGVVELELSASALGIQRIGGIAVEGDQLAISDSAMGQVILFRLRAPR